MKKEKEALRKLCDVYMQISDDKLPEMMKRQILEIMCNEQDPKERP